MPKESLERLKGLRLDKGETLKEVAESISISTEYYWMLENGKRKLSYELAVKIANHFHKTPDDIFLSLELTTS
ncbi:helix-turn-helix transcriptional regulator [Alkalibacterium sp. f15]|uniref:helix-turn-helix transcriptional regulator n=1 Tax=Alkalibacterium sp. f15 TaxID=3414029 RepID=UPI003BF8CA95